MYYKTLSARLNRCGWKCIKEDHNPGEVYLFKWKEPAWPDEVHIVTAENKDGTPGKVLASRRFETA